MAVADTLDKARYFVLGCTNLVIAVDHKPLLKIFGDRSLDQISNAQLRNLKERILRYHFKMVHIPGIKNRASDVISLDTPLVTLSHPRCSCRMMMSLPSLISYSPLSF